MSDSTIAAPLTMICGPTCGCGKGTPFIPDGHGTWLCPAACMHCGKSFGGSQWATGNPATVVTLTPFLFPDKAQLEIAELRSHVSTLTQSLEESQKVRDAYATAARVIHLHLVEFCDESLPFDEMIADAARKAAAQLSTLTQARDEATRLVGVETRNANYLSVQLESARSALQSVREAAETLTTRIDGDILDHEAGEALNTLHAWLNEAHNV
jgi:hypothetical protein